ncbi:MAG: hypothetical protein J6M02_00220 [Clostridia bacterium]|nr:hypothetical protein [Clostridia bacterium]
MKDCNWKVGDYVEYVPNQDKCVILARDSGHKEDQEFFPSKTRLWRVFRWGEEIELVAAKSGGKLTLCGFEGFQNSADILNYLSEAHVNRRYASCGRSLGSQSPMIPVNRGITFPIDAQGIVQAGVPRRFDAGDVEQLNAYDLFPSKRGMVWLAANYRILNKGEEYCNCRCVRCENGDAVGVCLQYTHCGEYPKQFAQTKNVMPIVRLRPEVRLEEGMGTEKSPYKVVI